MKQPFETHILVVEDDPSLQELLHQNLRFEGYQVSCVSDGQAGWEALQKPKYDLLILDLMLPKMSGIELCKKIRQQANSIPMIMLTARSSRDDIVRGLKLGADDYICKPFDLMELLARIEVVLRRGKAVLQYSGYYQLGDLRIDFEQHTIYKGKDEINLTRQEMLLLRYLVHHEGQILSREKIFGDVWGHDQLYTYRTIDTHITKLRQKIEATPARPKHILTVHRVGYKFVP